MSRLRILVLVAVMAMIAVLVIPVVATAQAVPCSVQGTVTLDGVAAADGTVVTATIEGTKVGEGTVADGKYKVRFDVGANAGKTIDLMVGTAKANETAICKNGFVYANLTANSGVTPTPTPTVEPGTTTPEPGCTCVGEKGDTGAAGKDGVNGTNGTNGTNGEDGKDGSAALGIVALIIAIIALIAAAFVMLKKKAA